MTELQNRIHIEFAKFDHLDFEFVSGFDIRISDL